jgi:hypothetical protein
VPHISLLRCRIRPPRNLGHLRQPPTPRKGLRSNAAEMLSFCLSEGAGGFSSLNKANGFNGL